MKANFLVLLQLPSGPTVYFLTDESRELTFVKKIMFKWTMLNEPEPGGHLYLKSLPLG